MRIQLGYDLRFSTPAAVAMVALLQVHPSRRHHLQTPDQVGIDPAVAFDQYQDSFGNLCTRFVAPAGEVRLYGASVIDDSGEPDPQNHAAREVPVAQLPADTLRYLLPSRYCEVDRLSNVATDLFGGVAPGWGRVQAVCDWVHQKVTFGYQHARSTRTAQEAYVERVGVCRDFQHLAITFCRCLNIPARYVTGYLGDIAVLPNPAPMDFSAWFEVYLDGQWWTFDARHNQARVGRVLMAVGRDATDVALTTSFGAANLSHFEVTTLEVPETGGQRPLMG
jgi:transglutaminase-like putative cysteine protease